MPRSSRVRVKERTADQIKLSSDFGTTAQSIEKEDKSRKVKDRLSELKFNARRSVLQTLKISKRYPITMMVSEEPESEE